ncbi:MAG: glycosyltransferase family 4 protein [Candidatus Hydrogenedentes bacterium]|nr:glycosyltransferase family 4 protein [Candidatus Hydrogenedentota bacterium]
MREICVRLADEGHYVAMVSADPGGGRSERTPRPRIESVDGVQLARLGTSTFYRFMARLLLSRLAGSGKLSKQYDVVVDCVYGLGNRPGHPLPLSQYVGETPVLPLVFSLARRFRADPTPPGPVIAATGQARRDLNGAGLADNWIVSAPYGADTERFSPGPGRAAECVVAAEARSRGLLDKAAKRLARGGAAPQLEYAWASEDGEPAGDERVARYRRAWLGYCGEGREWLAPAMGACGLAVVCPDTAAGRDLVVDGETGLLHRRGKARDLARQMERLFKDEVLRERLGAGGLERARQNTWARSAGLVLSAIENL